VMKVNQKRPPKTIKEKKFVKAYLKTGNATEAVITAEYDVKNRKVAKSIGSENLTKLDLATIMERKGLTDEKIIEFGLSGMYEPKKIHGTNDNFVELDDWATRHRYFETMLKLKGDLKDGGTVNIDNRSQTINNYQASPKELQEFTKWRDEQRRARLQKSTTGSTK